MGVKFVSGPRGTMTGLHLDGSGALDGIQVASGDMLRADRYILTTGAASPQVLPELANQLWSKCWSLAHVELTDEECAQWKGIPVISNFELGFCFEPDPETSEYSREWVYLWRIRCNTRQGGSRSVTTRLATNIGPAHVLPMGALHPASPYRDTPALILKMASLRRPRQPSSDLSMPSCRNSQDCLSSMHACAGAPTLRMHIGSLTNILSTSPSYWQQAIPAMLSRCFRSLGITSRMPWKAVREV